ncbi:NAD(P)H-hydrate epimerase [Helicobacter mustelae]|nr:NAD(P)H-hydrate epimerase [Helicobacter mustelae]SQH71330.1 carbohydrate kinase family protein [Helicobacter mustelae]
MQNLYKDTKALDSRCYMQFGLEPEILMENAGNALKNLIMRLVQRGSVISIVCGGGDNGGDGYVLARQLLGDYRVWVYSAKPPKSKNCIKQHERATALGVEFVKKLLPCDVVVDCFIGSGLQSTLDAEANKLIDSMNRVGRIKIACDIPSGVRAYGDIAKAFLADYTLAMGARNVALYRDEAKAYVGVVEVGDLGVSASKYEVDSHIKLLEASDLQLPLRKNPNVHKGDFGHLCVYAGEKSGAGSLCALAGLRIGAGSVSVIGDLHPYFAEVMYMSIPSAKTSAFCIGMGMGTEIPEVFLALDPMLPCVLDADILRHERIAELLSSHQNIVITPHCGEFLNLWERCGMGELAKEDFLADKMEYFMRFCSKYPHVVMVLKGANVMIAKKDRVYINALGNAALAKAGSGDVLAGIIGGLLAQGFLPLEAALHGSLIHSLCAQDFCEKNYALTPLDIIATLGRVVLE